MNVRRLLHATAASSVLLVALAPSSQALGLATAPQQTTDGPSLSTSGKGSTEDFGEPRILGGKGTVGKTLTSGMTTVGESLQRTDDGSGSR